MPRRCDLWRIGIVAAPIEAIADAGSLERFAIDWLKEPSDFRFRADPFAIRRDGALHLFAEAYDYRDRHGRIVHATIGAGRAVSPWRVVLAEPWHLSYPQLIEQGDDVFLLPEASKGGGLNLYRAAPFPEAWAPVARITLDVVPVDATLFRHDHRWWLAYASGASAAAAQSTLHLAFADRIEGTLYAASRQPGAQRPVGGAAGGTPFRIDGGLVLPVQDCVATYGAAVRLLAVDELTTTQAMLRPITRIGSPSSAGRYREGLHTLSGCGDVTLIDVKRVDRSGRGWLIDARRLIAPRG